MYSKAARAVAAKGGLALPNGSYPIRNKRELRAAVRRRHQGKAPYAQIVGHILNRAKSLGIKVHMTSSAAPAPAPSQPVIKASPAVLAAYDTVTAVPSTVAAVYAKAKK
jgi:hypothetical protein